MCRAVTGIAVTRDGAAIFSTSQGLQNILTFLIHKFLMPQRCEGIQRQEPTAVKMCRISLKPVFPMGGSDTHNFTEREGEHEVSF